MLSSWTSNFDPRYIWRVAAVDYMTWLVANSNGHESSSHPFWERLETAFSSLLLVIS